MAGGTEVAYQLVLKEEASSGLSGWSQCNHRVPRAAKEAEEGVNAPTTATCRGRGRGRHQEVWASLEAGEGQEMGCHLEPPEGTQP